MAMRGSCRADGRDWFLVIAVLTMMLGSGLVGLALVGPGPLPQAAMERSTSPAGAVPPGAATSPVIVTRRFISLPVCHPGAIASHAGPGEFPPLEKDHRVYLNKMAELRFRRDPATPVAFDPYQASLNPAVYVGYPTTNATPILHDGAPTSVLHDRLCGLR